MGVSRPPALERSRQAVQNVSRHNRRPVRRHRGREAPMSEYPAVFGIDSHARTTTVCAIVVETGETATRTFPGVSPYAEAASWMSPFPGPRMGWYEAGCTGFAPALHALRRRHARGADSHPLHAHEPRGQGEEDRPDGRRQARQGWPASSPRSSSNPAGRPPAGGGRGRLGCLGQARPRGPRGLRGAR